MAETPDSIPLAEGAGTPAAAVRKRRRLIAILWLIALGLGAVHAWGHRHAMGGDGIAYMDVASAYTRGDWDQVVNGYWSPLYSWLLAAGLIFFKPLPHWDAGVAHAVNFVIYCFALGCFHYFWAGLLKHRRFDAAAAGQNKMTPLPEWAWFALGYALFCWSSLNLVTLRLVTPDLCVAGWLYLLAGVVLRIRMGATSYRTFALLGLILALAYLTKLFVLTVGMLFLAVSLLVVVGAFRKTIPRAALALLVLAVVAGPWVVAVSLNKGRFTIGESGRLNYAYMINGAHPWYHWHGLPPGTGTPKHPTRQLLDKPAVYEFAEPVGGSYPVWYDNSYWCDGIEPSFNLQGHIKALSTTTNAYFKIFFHQQGGMIFCMVALLVMRRSWRGTLRDLVRPWFLLLPALAGLGLYAVTWVEPRLVAGFVVLLWSVILYAVRLPDTAESKRMMHYVSIAALLAMLVVIGWESIPALRRTALDLRHRTDTAPHRQWDIARELHEMGIQPGDKVAHVGQALKSWSYWARLADVQIMAELRPVDSFWVADDATKAKVMDIFAEAGAKAAITRKMHINDRPFGLPVDFAPGWRRIGKTDHYVYFLTDHHR